MIALTRLPGGRAAAALTLTGLLTAGTIAAGAGPASATTRLTVRYPVSGSTYLKAPSATMALGPGKLTSTVNLARGTISASLALPPATASFKQFGFIPVSATTEFLQDGRTTGRLNLNTGAIASTSKIILKVTSLTVAGIPIPVGGHCESGSPAVVRLRSQRGFSVVRGGRLSGTYTIPSFAHCGLVTALLNLTVPGPGNTITLTLGRARRVR